MHKVRDNILDSVYAPIAVDVFLMVVFTSILALTIGFSLDYKTPVYLWYNFVIPFLWIFYKIHYRMYTNKIHSHDQPYPGEVLERFYQWEKGDEIKVPPGRKPYIEGKYVGVGDDNSVILEIDSGFSEKPVEDISGREVHKPKYYEVPPNLFEEAGYKNESLFERLQEKEEQNILSKLEESYTDEITETIKSEELKGQK